MSVTEEGVVETSGAGSSVPGFAAFTWRVMALQMVTYFLAGIAAYSLFDYKTLFSTGPLRDFMRPVDSVWVAIGPGLQFVRGALFALVLYPFAAVFLSRKRGWLTLWGLFLGLAILGTAGPTPGSLEGVIYTKLTLGSHLRGLPEVVTQTLLFSLGLVAWCHRPARWKNALAIVAVALIVLMSIAGALAAAGILKPAGA
jgi:hypothetical protein